MAVGKDRGGDAACEIRFRDGAGRFVRLSMDEEAFRLCREGIYADRNQRKRDRSHGVLRCCELRGPGGEWAWTSPRWRLMSRCLLKRFALPSMSGNCARFWEVPLRRPLLTSL